MLVLSRQRDEILTITVLMPGGPPIEVEITIVDIRGDKVRLGAEATREGVPLSRDKVLIDRKEIAEARKKGTLPDRHPHASDIRTATPPNGR